MAGDESPGPITVAQRVEALAEAARAYAEYLGLFVAGEDGPAVPIPE